MWQLTIPDGFTKSSAYKNFERGLRKNAPATRENYKWCLRTFMKWRGSENPDEFLQGTNEDMENKIISYIDHSVNIEKLAGGSIRMKTSALREKSHEPNQGTKRRHQ